ncbi:hypothetical protein VRRI112168_03600 [Vreelandella rituensis]|uniref:Uncharacterized protein n=1 Tax=Vreelandella rituensis TaxID=2282306 RepID=A0A368U949_9GAMM|nr:hypothetical protein [Halomonas rituensis]RCV93738.1 hypothetical protein DU506_00870 [Halomonas rituensis]
MNAFIKRLKRQPESNPLGDLPLMPGGCFALQHADKANMPNALAALLRASQQYCSRHTNGDAVFLIGLDPTTQQRHFPDAMPLIPEKVLDGLTLSPGTYAMLLRMLHGETELIDHQHDLLLLEMLGMDAPKPIPLPLFPEWVEDQLKPENLIRILTHPMGGERAAGAALKALMMHPSFSFAALDSLPSVAQRVTLYDKDNWNPEQRRLNQKSQQLFRDWQQHAQKITLLAAEIAAAPPPEFFFLAELQRCIKQGGTWVIPDEKAANVAASLHVMGMANGLRQRNHWYVDLSAPDLQEKRAEIQRSLERFAVQLWQQGDARQNGFGPSLWVYWDAPALGHTPRRLLHGTQATLASLDMLSPLLDDDRERRGIEEDNEEVMKSEELDRSYLGLFESQSGQFRHLKPQEIAALDCLSD